MKPVIVSKSVSRKGLAVLLGVVLVILGVSSVWLSSRVSSEGERLEDLERRASQLRLENQLLEQSVVERRSLTRIEPEAGKLGFSYKPANLIIAPDEVVAQLIDSR